MERESLVSLKDKIRASTKAKAEKNPAQVTRTRARTMAMIAEVKRLTELLGPNKNKAVQVWIDGLEATKRVQVGRDQWEDVPDWKERRENANMIVAYLEGKPIERAMVATGTFEDYDTLRARIEGSPLAAKLLGIGNVQETGGEKQADVTREE